MPDNIKMAAEGTQFSDANVSLAWGVGRDESEVIAVPPASRGTRLLQAIAQGLVVETNDPVTPPPEAPAVATVVRVLGDPEEGEAPIFDAEQGVWIPATAGTNVSGPEDVPGLEEALDEKADSSEIVRKIDASLLIATGDMIYRPGAVNYATAELGASATGGGNQGSPADTIDGNDATWFQTFNFGDPTMRVDLGQVRAIGGFRVKANGGAITHITASSGPSSSGPWTAHLTQALDGGSIAQGDLSNVIDARHWRFTVSNHNGLGVNWYTIEILAAAVPARLPIGTDGQILKVVGGVPTWSDP